MPTDSQPPEPWRSFFADLDEQLTERVDLHCCGGFVATQLYGVARTTSDVDFLAVVPNLRSVLDRLAGQGSALHKKHKVYLDPVTVATPPEDHEERLIPMFPNTWPKVHLFALEVHDLALSKLERNFERDSNDVQHLARAGCLEPEILQERYTKEMRPNLISHEERHDMTLKQWLEFYF
jgi:hypothetical protein